MENINKLKEDIIGAAIEVHKYFGPGLLESIYEKGLEIELTMRGHKVQHQVLVPIYYKGQKIIEENPMRMDLIVDDTIIVELKATETISKVHIKQLASYLKLFNKKEGLLFNFNALKLMPQGFARVNIDNINTY